MKSIKYSLIGAALIATVALSSCQDSYDAPDLKDPVASMTPNTTLLELKQMIAQDAGSNANYAALVPKKDNGEDIVIHGRVVSCDASGNIYQSLVIQDETTALNLSIREDKIWSYYREGQDVVLNATGLYMGLFNGLYQLGWLGEYHEAPSLTFMSWDMFLNHNELNGLPNQNYQEISFNDPWPSANPYCLVTNNIGDINHFSGGNMQLMSQLVEIRNVSFDEGGIETFAPYQSSGQNRTITDAFGNSLTVRNSGYSNFYNKVLPTGTGNVRGILSYYNGWQLLLRDINDVMFEDMAGQVMATALTVSEAINLENLGRSLWVKGYVVGSVKGNVSTIRSNDDIIFSADADFPNTVVIAATPNETNYANCMVVELPMGTFLYEDLNLVDNPGLYKQMIYVKGGLNEYLGINGITSPTEYYYDGMPDDGEEVTFLTSGYSDFTEDNIMLPAGSNHIWSWDTNYNCVKASAFVSNSNKACEGYLISPAIQLSRNPQVTVEQALNFLNGNTMSDYIEICVREGESGDWTPVTFTGMPNGSSWNFTTSTLNLTAYAGKTVQIAFHYRTTTSCAPTWEIKNLIVK